MKTASDFWVEAQNDPSYWSEVAKSDMAVEIYQHMEQQGISRAKLAEKVGVSKQYISKILGGNINFTIDSMSKLLFALGRRLDTSTLPIEKACPSQSFWPDVETAQIGKETEKWNSNIAMKVTDVSEPTYDRFDEDLKEGLAA